MTASPDPSDFAPDVDTAAVAVYAEVVFGYTEGFVAVRILPEKGMPTDKAITKYLKADATLAEGLVAMARRARTLGRALYVVPGTVRVPGAATRRDLHQTAVIVVDLDLGPIKEKREHLVRALGEPTLEITSGGVTDAGEPKLHLYWLLTEAAGEDDLDYIADLRKTIAAMGGGDASFGQMTQPIRVAGSIHAKHGKRSPVRIVVRRNVEYDLVEFAEVVRSLPPFRTGGDNTSESGVGCGSGGPSIDDLLRRIIHENGVDGITRFQAISKVAGHFIHAARTGRITVDDAWARLESYNGSNISPSWPQPCLRREFDSILKLDQRKNQQAWAELTEATRSGPEVSMLPTPGSDDALAAAFVDQHGDDWVFVPAWNKWLVWTGTHWSEDATRLVLELVRQVCRSEAAPAKATDARRISSARTIAAVERIAASDPAIARTVGVLDADQWVLNCADGILDLRTGEVRPHDRDALITRLSPAHSSGSCPRWLAFITEITGGDTDLAGYLQRFAGYCLTGVTSEQVFAFFHGGGANGKSVFLQVIAHVMGDYAMTAALDTFISSQGDRHSTDLAGLRGARLVVVTETEPGRTWAESRIKAITGGDSIRARRLYQDNFEFTPTFKLIVAGNHRPGFANLGEAMQRRLHLVPFTVTIPRPKRDKDLAEKLKAEADGILGWMIAGCAEWQRIGLVPPTSVVAAGEEYFAAEDVIGQWIDEQCIVGQEHRSTAADLFGSWKSFAEAGGHPYGSKKTLGEALRERGFKAGTVGRGRGWMGIAVRRREGEQ
jgi:putative DNA primase/helicase